MDENQSPPKYSEAVHAAQHLQAFIRVLPVFRLALAHGPLRCQRWDCVDEVTLAMQRLRDLAEHGPTRHAMQQDHDGTGQALALLTDPQLAQMLAELQRIRSGLAGTADQLSAPGQGLQGHSDLT
jgi:hypothetical protein